jgi:AcrR family transcriptional regulator
MPNPRFKRLPIERQRQILDAAAKELGTHGYEGTSLNRILREAGLSKGAAYYCFDGKDDLVATVLVDLWERLLEGTPLALDEMTEDSFWPKLFRFASELVAKAKNDTWAIAAAKAVWKLPPGARTHGVLADTFRELSEWLLGVIRRGRELGVIRNDVPEMLLLSMVLAMDEAADRWMVEHWDSLDDAEIERISGVTFQMWQRMMMPVEQIQR